MTMSRTDLVITLACLSLTASSAAFSQTSSSSPGGGAATPITAVGCISPAVHDGSLAGGPGVPPATPNTAPILANSGQPTGAFLLNGATGPEATAEDRQHAAAGHPLKDEGVTYELEGMDRDVPQHAGKLVEVTGTLTHRTRGREAETKAPIHHLALTGLKVLAATCSRVSAK